MPPPPSPPSKIDSPPLSREEARFWAKVDVRGKDECWEWTASRRGRMGYGQFVNAEGRHEMAHRAAWRLTRGRPAVPLALHTCDNPPCCNPAHLYEGTHADNVADRMNRGRGRPGGAVGVRNGRAKLSPSTVDAVRSAYASGVKQADLARTFGVGQSTISRVVRRENWEDRVYGQRSA